MKLLVTGATGFIGQHLVDRLVADGHTVAALVRPSTKTEVLTQKGVQPLVFTDDVSALIADLQAAQFDGVLHLASLFLAQHKSEDIAGLIESNVFFSTAILEAAAKAGVPWFINTGTFWQHYESRAYDPVNLYAATKQAFEVIAQYYWETTDLNFVTLKLSDTFGPNDTRPKIFSLWTKIAASGEAMGMSPGEQILDISYVGNVIDGYVRLIELLSTDSARAMNGQSYALTSGERMTLKELAAVFEEVTGKKLAITWGEKPYRPREVMVPWETGQPIPGWQPRVSLREGMKKTLNG